MEQMGDMLDSVRRQANVAHWREIGAHIPHDAKNTRSRKKGKRHLDDVLRIKFSPFGIEQCEGEEWVELIVKGLYESILIYRG
jgi:hypothetical protein